MPAVRVRAREPGDAEALTEIMNCPGVIYGTLQIPFRSVEERREQFKSSSLDTRHLVAELDGRVVGNLGLHLETSPRRRHCGHIGMAVHDDFQGRGVGTALMEAVIDLADNWYGLQRLELTVYADNEPAIRLYKKFGFATEGIGRKYALRNGKYVDAYFMARVREEAGYEGG